jgi:tripartite ATP-independent transporter DctM subunit
MGLPLGLAMIASGICYLALRGLDLGIAAEQIVFGLYNSYVLIAIPLFIFTARVMNAGTISERLLNFALALVGHRKGGLAQVNVVTSLIFSGMSGSAVADVAGIGYVITRMMMAKNRYPAAYACAVTAASATVGPIIPPSILFILYALVADVSVGALFLGGVVPGLIMAIVMMTLVSWQARRRGFPTEERTSISELPLVLVNAILPLLMPVVLLGGIYSGGFTPTEAAAVAATYAILVSALAFRALGPATFWNVVIESARASGAVLTLIVGAFLLNYIVALERLPLQLTTFLAEAGLSPLQFLLVLNVVFLLLGCVLSTSTMMLVVVPLVIPTAQTLGIDLLHLGVVLTVNMMIGLLTPPYGVLLFVTSGLVGVPVGAVIREVLPFVAVLIAALLAMVLVPDVVTFLPRLFE